MITPRSQQSFLIPHYDNSQEKEPLLAMEPNGHDGHSDTEKKLKSNLPSLGNCAHARNLKLSNNRTYNFQLMESFHSLLEHSHCY